MSQLGKHETLQWLDIFHWLVVIDDSVVNKLYFIYHTPSLGCSAHNLFTERLMHTVLHMKLIGACKNGKLQSDCLVET